MDIKELFGLTKNCDVLYVEDDPHFNEETTEFLSDYFQSVDATFDGKEGLKRYTEYIKTNNRNYDLVITDIEMPNMDGIELAKEIYKINDAQKLVVISAYSDPDYLMRLIDIGIDKFILKPFSYDEITQTLYTIFHKNKEIHIGKGVIWDRVDESVSQNGKTIKLTTKELLLLKLFIKNQSRVSLTQEIFNTVWCDDSSIATNDALKSLLSRLRKKLDGVKIESIYNLGYKMEF